MTLIIDIHLQSPLWQQDAYHDQFNDRIQALCEAAQKASGILAQAQRAELSVVLTDDNHIQELNAQYRGKDKPTNVLSFPIQENLAMPTSQSLVLGDIVLAYETIAQEALSQHKTFPDHFSHLVVHGFLHLLGYDHEKKAQAEQMEQLEASILEGLGIKNPYEPDEKS